MPPGRCRSAGRQGCGRLFSDRRARRGDRLEGDAV